MAFDEKAAADPEAASELAINTFEEIAGEHDAINLCPQRCLAPASQFTKGWAATCTRSVMLWAVSLSTN